MIDVVGVKQPSINSAIRDFNKNGMEVFERTTGHSVPTVFARRLSQAEDDKLKEMKRWWSSGNERGISRQAFHEATAAKVILASASGRNISEINEQTGMSKPAIGAIIKNFNQVGMAMFNGTISSAPPGPYLRRDTPEVLLEQLSMKPGKFLDGRTSNLFARKLTNSERLKLDDMTRPLYGTQLPDFALDRAKRAKAVLLSDLGYPLPVLSHVLNMNYQFVVYTIKSFNEHGMQIFK